jgi:photosystem II stability/assembly factor-like uncharacterized protein
MRAGPAPLTPRSASSIALFVASAALFGCAQLPQSAVPPTAVVAASGAVDCVNANAMSDKAFAKAIDVTVQWLDALRTFGKTDNVGVCRMNWDERNDVMLGYRNTLKDPNRKMLRAPKREYLLSWNADDNGEQPTSSQFMRAEAKRRELAEKNPASQAKAAGISQGAWTFIGPSNVGGRVRALVFDPRNPNRLFVGAASGGIWLSNDAGQSFSPLIEFNGNLVIGSMAIDPINPNNMYAGTGEWSTGFVGLGIFKSTDGGLTWNLLPSTSTDTSSDWRFVSRIAVHRTNPNLILAGNFGGIYRSTNGGTSWTKVRNGNTLDVQFDPTTPDRVIASGTGGFAYYSSDAGATWTDAPKFFPNALRSSTARSEFAWATTTPGLVYAAVDNSDQTSGSRGEVYKSEDGGVNWTFLSSPKHLASQGFYNNSIWVDPTNSSNIVIGGIDLHRSTDGGLTFTRISTWQQWGPGLPQPHADQHQIVASPDFSSGNPVVYIGNDGGLVRSTNVFTASATGTSTWQNLSSGLSITQFYGGAGRAAAGGRIIGGTQDNGDLRFSAGTNWTRIGGGDGGFAAVDPIDDSVHYGEYVYGSIRRYGGPGASPRYICNGITEAKKDESNITYCGPNATEQTNFITPFILDPNARDRMFVGAASLWVSDDVRTVLSPAWRAIKPPATAAGSVRFINAIDVQRGDSNVIWVGHNATNSSGTPTPIFKTTDGLSGSPTWVNVAQSGMPTSTINRITIDPDNPNRVWVAYSGFSTSRLWVTENGGATWRDLSSGLPAVTLFDVKRHPVQPNWLYVAGANGVYTSENLGTTWTTANDGPNSVIVRELIWYDNTTLIAVTHGRGMFRTSVIPDNVSTLSFASSTASITEGAGTVDLTVQRIGTTSSSVSVNFAAQSTGTGIGSALAGTDFTATTGTLNWPVGDGSSKVVSVPILDASTARGYRTFSVVLSSPNNASLGTSVANVTIIDNQPDAFPAGCAVPTNGWSVPAGANAGWVVATNAATEGTCSLRAAPIGDSQRATIQFTGNFLAGNVTFDRRVSSEATWDCLQFSIDGVVQNLSSNCSGAGLVGASGETGWASMSFPIAAGTRTLTWSYIKDENTIGGSDTAWIDKLSMPLASSAVTLTVNKTGTGSGTVTSSPGNIDCGATCSGTVAQGSTVTLTAAAANGSFLTGWTNCTSTTNTTCTVTVSAATTVTANFALNPPLAALSKRGGYDLDGNGRSAIVLRATNSNQLMAGRLVNNAFQWTNMVDPGADFRLLGAVDFLGSNRADLGLLRENPLNSNGQGAAQYWPNFIGTSPVFLRDVRPAWDVQAIGDLDGDGFGDLVWRFRGQSANIDDQGVSYIWFTSNGSVAQVRKRGGAPLTWTLLGATDLNGDGAADMIYVSPANAMRVLMATPSRTCANLSGGSLPTGFTALKLADFTGNRRGDVLARNAATGEVRLVGLNAMGLNLPPYTGAADDPNASCTGSTLSLAQTVFNIGTADPTWSFFATGDFNGDGIFDVVWRQPNGTLTLWLFNANGAAPSVISNAGTAPSGMNAAPLQ